MPAPYPPPLPPPLPARPGPLPARPGVAEVTARLAAAGCVFAREEARLLVTQFAGSRDLIAAVDRRCAGVPLEHLLGWVRFCGRPFTVRAGVFVPRRRSEFLVHQAAAVTARGAVVADLCCGCGALGAAVHALVGGVHLHACDIDPVALGCARVNLPPDAAVYQGDLFAALPDALRGRIDTLVANVPYVPTEAIALLPPEAREHEPRASLDGGTDGLDVLRRVLTRAGDWLAPRGHLLCETSAQQAPTAAVLVTAAGLPARVVTSRRFGASVVVGAA